MKENRADKKCVHGIVLDERGQEQPTDKERAQAVAKPKDEKKPEKKGRTRSN